MNEIKEAFKKDLKSRDKKRIIAWWEDEEKIKKKKEIEDDLEFFLMDLDLELLKWLNATVSLNLKRYSGFFGFLAVLEKRLDIVEWLSSDEELRARGSIWRIEEWIDAAAVSRAVIEGHWDFIEFLSNNIELWKRNNQGNTQWRGFQLGKGFEGRSLLKNWEGNNEFNEEHAMNYKLKILLETIITTQSNSTKAAEMVGKFGFKDEIKIKPEDCQINKIFHVEGLSYLWNMEEKIEAIKLMNAENNLTFLSEDFKNEWFFESIEKMIQSGDDRNNRCAKEIIKKISDKNKNSQVLSRVKAIEVWLECGEILKNKNLNDGINTKLKRI